LARFARRGASEEGTKMAKRLLGPGLLVVAAIGCSNSANLDQVPIGSDVQVTRDDGGVVEGTLTERTDESVKVDVGPVTRVVKRDDVAHVAVPDEDGKAPELPAIARFREYQVPSSTRIAIRLAQAVSSDTSKAGQAIEATLAEAVRIDGVDVLPAGSLVRAEVTEAEESGKVKGRARLTLAFSGIAAHGESYPIDASYAMVAPATKAKDAKTIGIPAAGGAVLGGILGGGKGAAIGAAVGGGAGTAVVLSTSGEEVGLASGSRVTVTLGRTLEVKVPVSPRSDS
jgi:hypothetical protein